MILHFADPPYNLGKKYLGYTDDLEIQSYFKWCDAWIAEVARVIKPGGTFALLNIPLYAVQHFLFMHTMLEFQNWIVWDALGFPVRLIMPAHYTILCFAKGQSRPLPGLVRVHKEVVSERDALEAEALEALAPGFCLRSSCLKSRRSAGVQDKEPLTDLWNDIHRVKHNSRRVDHPCLLPPQLMHRLISLFTERNEVVLDCFNGAGTTTLSAAQLGRKFIGIEVSERYHTLAQLRHAELSLGMDPFRKQERALSAKNSRVPRMPKQDYVILKKTLQLEVKRVAELLGRLPTREEVRRLARYPIEYYNSYFASWGEVCAAARNGGMSETRKTSTDQSISETQLAFGDLGG
ncbi:MAG: site-specific DNA-methyltransferase [Chloroflexi bacterium]|nr:site-specific DNA-methyltransferase [Chloroflexota bacterium]